MTTVGGVDALKVGEPDNAFCLCRTALSSPSPTSGAAARAEPAPAGLWLSLEKFRDLPLSPAARLALLQDLLASPVPGSAVNQLLGELAELRLRCCEDAYQQQAWTEALEHHDALLVLVRQLVALAPERREVFWARYGELLAFFTVAAHGAVYADGDDISERARRAELAWQLAQRLRGAAPLPIQPPDWLAVHEEQLVQKGVFLFEELLTAAGEAAERPWQEEDQRALDLVVHLQTLLDPAPEWLAQKQRALLERQVGAVLALDLPAAEQLAGLLANLERLPVPAERRGPLTTALSRARLSLDLLAPELQLAAATEVEAVAEVAPSVPDSPATAAGPGLAELVWLEAGDQVSPLQLDLAPLLTAGLEQIEEALDDFCWHLPRGSRALTASRAITKALEPRWRAGERLEAKAFERLAFLAASWQRRLAARLDPLSQHDWRYGLVVELATTELDVLLPLLKAPQQLEGVMAELRREHHNPAFWQQRQDVPWMECPPPLEALRRLHVEEGFYARSHPPMESLQSWGREVALALGESEPWTDDAGCLGRWLAVAQELALSQQGPVPELGQPPKPEQLLAELGGLEVLYVGDGATAVLEAHRSGRCFRGEPFGLRALEPPSSRWPARPAGGFEQSLAVLLEIVDGLYRQRPFAVLLADCGAYRLPLLRAVHQRYGVAALSSGRPMARWLAGD